MEKKFQGVCSAEMLRGSLAEGRKKK